MKIVTHGYLEGFYYKPRVDTEILKKYNEGIICLSACLKGILPETLIYNGLEAGKQVAEEYSSIFPVDITLNFKIMVFQKSCKTFN